MQSYDMLMLAVLAVATLFGFWKGLAWQLASIASIFLSYVAAVYFRGPVAAAIDAEPPWNMFLAMLIIYITASLVIWIAFSFVRRIINQLQLKGFDRQIGGVLGLAKGILLCVIITLFAVTLLSDQRRTQIVNSTSGYYIAVLLDRSHSIMPPEVHEVLHPYIENLDANHGKGGPARPAPTSTFGGPLFGGNSNSGQPIWPINPTSNPTLTGDGQQGSWPASSSQQPQSLKDWTDEQVRMGQRAVDEQFQSGQEAIQDQIQSSQQTIQQNFREGIQKQLDRYLPGSR